MIQRRHGRWMAVSALIIATGVGLGSLAPTMARAQGDTDQLPGAGANDPVVARVDDEPIYYSEVQWAYSQLPQQYRGMPLEQLFEPVLQQLIASKLLAAAGREAGLDDDPNVRRERRLLDERLLSSVFIARLVDKEATEKKLREAYDEFVANYKGEDEVHARHILVKTREEAEEVVKALKNGADFVDLAKEKSTGPTGQVGGDLGFFKRGDMVKPFSDAAFALKPGEISEPVKTQFGWHVIKVEERRKSPAPSFEQVRNQLRYDLAARILERETNDLRAKVDIQIYGPQGEDAARDGGAE